MHILLIADGRSPNTYRWLQGMLALQHRITLVSTYPCEPLPGVEAIHVLPVAFATQAGSQLRTAAASPAAGGSPSPIKTRLRAQALSARYLLGPLTLPGYGRRLHKLIQQIQPDLIHALRIPFEGMLAAAADAPVPLAVSIWGNDLTLHANHNPAMQRWTRRTMRRANGLLADAHRDIRLGWQWGFPRTRPAMVLPGGGGIDLGAMHRLLDETPDLPGLDIPADAPLVLNPRGFRRGSVRNDVFFEAVPLVLQRCPDTLFACAGMAGQTEALEAVQRLGVSEQVRLLPYLPQAQLWRLFEKAGISVTVSQHDGTPNSLLEAMSLGCFPIAGDIESLREWITPGVNGLLIEPTKPDALADAIVTALDNPALRAAAAEANLEIIRARAAASLVRSQMEVFYQQVLG